jgi:hypothetical protein
MSLAEIMLGKSDVNYPGLIPLVRLYLDEIDSDEATKLVVNKYLQLISDRVTGKLLTTAAFFRKFVSIHPNYAKDSQLNQSIVYDLIQTADHIQQGKVEVNELLGKLTNCPESKNSNSSASVPLSSKNLKLDLNDPNGCKKFRELVHNNAKTYQQQDQNSNTTI